MEENEIADGMVETGDGLLASRIRRDWVWIRLLGFPLNLWSEKVFQQNGELCGVFIETEEETTVKNHLH